MDTERRLRTFSDRNEAGEPVSIRAEMSQVAAPAVSLTSTLCPTGIRDTGPAPHPLADGGPPVGREGAASHAVALGSEAVMALTPFLLSLSRSYKHWAMLWSEALHYLQKTVAAADVDAAAGAILTSNLSLAWRMMTWASCLAASSRSLSSVTHLETVAALGDFGPADLSKLPSADMS